MNVSTATILLCLVALTTARDAGQASVIEADVTPAAVAPIVMEVEDPDLIAEIVASELVNDPNLDNVNPDDITVEVTAEEGNPISTRSKRHLGPIGFIVVKVLITGKIIAHYTFKIVKSLGMGFVHGLIG